MAFPTFVFIDGDQMGNVTKMLMQIKMPSDVPRLAITSYQNVNTSGWSKANQLIQLRGYHNLIGERVEAVPKQATDAQIIGEVFYLVEKYKFEKIKKFKLVIVSKDKFFEAIPIMVRQYVSKSVGHIMFDLTAIMEFCLVADETKGIDTVAMCMAHAMDLQLLMDDPMRLRMIMNHGSALVEKIQKMEIKEGGVKVEEIMCSCKDNILCPVHEPIKEFKGQRKICTCFCQSRRDGDSYCGMGSGCECGPTRFCPIHDPTGKYGRMM
jgi:hypothetical protein